MNKNQLRKLFEAFDVLVKKRIAESTGKRDTHFPNMSDIVDTAAYHMGIVDPRPRPDQYGCEREGIEL